MDIGRPRAIRTLREFAVEIGTITLGILIALGLEALLQKHHERRLVEHARVSIRQELEADREALRQTIGQEKATGRVLDQMISDLSAGRRPSDNARLALHRITFRTLDTAAWESATATQALNLMPFDQSQVLAKAYATTRNFSGIQEDAARHWVELLASIRADGRSPIERDALTRLVALNRMYLNTQAGTGGYLLQIYDRALAGLD